MSDKPGLFDSLGPQPKLIDVRQWGDVVDSFFTDTETVLIFRSGDRLYLHPSVGFTLHSTFARGTAPKPSATDENGAPYRRRKGDA